MSYAQYRKTDKSSCCKGEQSRWVCTASSRVLCCSRDTGAPLSSAGLTGHCGTPERSAGTLGHPRVLSWAHWTLRHPRALSRDTGHPQELSRDTGTPLGTQPGSLDTGAPPSAQQGHWGTPERSAGLTGQWSKNQRHAEQVLGPEPERQSQVQHMRVPS